VPAPRPQWPYDPEYDGYRWSAQAFYGRARVLLATRPDEIGPFLYQAGRYADALPFLTAAAAARQPSLAGLALRAAARAGASLPPATRAGLERLAAPLAAVRDDDQLRAVFGLSARYLDALDFVTCEAEGLPPAGGHRVADPAAGGGLAVAVTDEGTLPRAFCMTPFLALDPGAYTLTARVRGTDRTGAPTAWRLRAADLLGRVLADEPLTLPPLDDRRYTTAATGFRLPEGGPPEVRLFLEPQDRAGVVLDRIEIHPDVLATVQALAALAGAASPPAEPAAPPGGFSQAVDTLFAGGLRLVSLRCSAAAVPRGRALGLQFDFRLEQPGLELDNLAVFIHAVDAAGRTVFQGDFGLPEVLPLHALQETSVPGYYAALAVPADARPGAYGLRVGICRLDNAARLRIRASPLPQKTKAVLLPRPLRVTE